jgi:hypothetical protein
MLPIASGAAFSKGAPRVGIDGRTWWNVAESARRIRAALAPAGDRAAGARRIRSRKGRG